MEPHVHANSEFEDIDDGDHVLAGVAGDWHLAYRLGPFGEDRAAHPPYLPLSISVSRPTVGASARTIRKGLRPPVGAPEDWPPQDVLEAYLDAVLRRIKDDIDGWTSETGEDVRFVTLLEDTNPHTIRSQTRTARRV